MYLGCLQETCTLCFHSNKPAPWAGGGGEEGSWRGGMGSQVILRPQVGTPLLHRKAEGGLVRRPPHRTRVCLGAEVMLCPGHTGGAAVSARGWRKV